MVSMSNHRTTLGKVCPCDLHIVVVCAGQKGYMVIEDLFLFILTGGDFSITELYIYGMVVDHVKNSCLAIDYTIWLIFILGYNYAQSCCACANGCRSLKMALIIIIIFFFLV
jgi:hypothetical protein